MKKTFSILLFTLSSINLWSQNTNIIDLFRSDFRQAEIYFKDLAYHNAIELYERELDRNPNNVKAMLQIAESYRLLKQPVQSEYWYNKASENESLPAIHNYHYAQVLSSNQKYREARALYAQFKEQNPIDSRSPSKIEFIDNMSFYLRDSALYAIEDANINSSATDFGPTYYKDGVVFLSSRDQDLFIKHSFSPSKAQESLFDMYFAKKSGLGAYTTPVKFQQQINTKFHEGPLSFGPGESLIFTRNNFYKGQSGRGSDGEMKLKLYFANLDKDRNLSNLRPFPFNDDEYSTAHPSWSSDGKTLYYSSDMPGGLGGADLYVSYYEGNAWTEPINLGSPINTEGNEMFPYKFENKLYFSSDGHGGFGGLDIYLTINSNNTYSDVINLGYPANSSYDDFSFIMNENGREGMFASDRPGSSEDDIYNYFVRHSVVAGQVIETDDRYPIPGATVILLDNQGEIIQSSLTNNNGQFHLDLPLDTDYSIDVTKDGFTRATENHSYASKTAFDVDSINVFMWAHDLFAQGTIYGNETQQTLSDVQLILSNFNSPHNDTIYTDDSGQYNFILESGNEYVISINKELFVPTQHKFNTLNFKKGVIRNDFIIEEEFLNKGLVLFDFNDDQLKPNFMAETNEILRILQRNPSTFLIISAHADSRGKKDYNLALSRRRASNIQEFYLRNGVEKKRIIARGFGEELIINRCSDGINCHEEDHSKNRRAELKIEKELVGEELR